MPEEASIGSVGWGHRRAREGGGVTAPLAHFFWYPILFGNFDAKKYQQNLQLSDQESSSHMSQISLDKIILHPASLNGRGRRSQDGRGGVRGATQLTTQRSAARRRRRAPDATWKRKMDPSSPPVHGGSGGGEGREGIGLGWGEGGLRVGEEGNDRGNTGKNISNSLAVVWHQFLKFTQTQEK